MSKPKPCPFCGREPQVYSVRFEDDGYEAVECARCAKHDKTGERFCGVHADTPDAAIQLWNRRAPVLQDGEGAQEESRSVRRTQLVDGRLVLPPPTASDVDAIIRAFSPTTSTPERHEFKPTFSPARCARCGQPVPVHIRKEE